MGQKYEVDADLIKAVIFCESEGKSQLGVKIQQKRNDRLRTYADKFM